MERVDREPEATGSDGGGNLMTTEKTAAAVPAGLEEEGKKKIKEGEVGSPEPDSPKKRKEPSTSDGVADDDDEDDDASANLIRMLKEEGRALLAAAKEAKEGRRTPAKYQPPVKKKRKKLVKQRLPKELIDYMIQRPHKTVVHISQESLAEGTEEFREWYTTAKAIADKMHEYQQALINQYRTKGYAENEIEVTDDEGDD